MFTFGYTSRKAALIKSVVVLCFGLAGISTRTTFGFVLGAILVAIGVRDLIWLLSSRAREKEKDAPAQQDPAPREDGLKITDLSDVKEVDYKKEEGSFTKE